MAFDWEQYRQEILRLYLSSRMTLVQLRDKLAEKYPSFRPSISSYRTKLREWGYLRKDAVNGAPGKRHNRHRHSPQHSRRHSLPRAQEPTINIATESPAVPELTYMATPATSSDILQGTTPHAISLPTTPEGTDSTFTDLSVSPTFQTKLKRRLIEDPLDHGTRLQPIWTPMQIPVSRPYEPLCTTISLPGVASFASSTGPSSDLVSPTSLARKPSQTSSLPALPSSPEFTGSCDHTGSRNAKSFQGNETTSTQLLHLIAMDGPSPEVLRTVMSNTEDVNAVNAAGETFLHVLNNTRMQSIEVAQSFLNYCDDLGYDFTCESVKGVTGLAAAQDLWPHFTFQLTPQGPSYSTRFTLAHITSEQSHEDLTSPLPSAVVAASEDFDLFDESNFVLGDDFWQRLP